MEAGWLLADALLTKSFPSEPACPTRRWWTAPEPHGTAGSTRSGCPRAGTRGPTRRGPSPPTWRPNARAPTGAALFEALLYVEKSLVHNHTDAQRLGYLAQYLRYLGLEQLAFEAAAAGYELAAAD